MGTWNIKCAAAAIDDTVIGGEMLSYEFDANDGDDDLTYIITYTDDDGCTGTTTFIHKACSCTPQFISTVTQDGDCFCDGINYTIEYYDKCKPEDKREKNGVVKISKENIKDYAEYGEYFNEITFADTVELDGQQHSVNVTLTSECYVREVKVFVELLGDAPNPIKILNSGEIPFSICDCDIDIAGYQTDTADYYNRIIPWQPTDSLFICQREDCNLNEVSIVFPDEINTIVGTASRTITYIKKSIVGNITKYASYDESALMQLSYRIVQTENAAVNVYIQFEET